MNKYLIKISGLYDHVIKPIGGIVAGIARDAGNSVHMALGGGFKDKAVELGIKNQNTLRGIKDQKSLTRALYEHQGKAGGFSAAKNRVKNLNAHSDGLLEGKRKGIVKAVGYAGATAYGGSKILDKVREMRDNAQYGEDPTYYQQQY